MARGAVLRINLLAERELGGIGRLLATAGQQRRHHEGLSQETRTTAIIPVA